MRQKYTRQEDDIILSARKAYGERFAKPAAGEILRVTGIERTEKAIKAYFVRALDTSIRPPRPSGPTHPLQKRFRHLSAATCARVQELREKYADILNK